MSTFNASFDPDVEVNVSLGSLTPTSNAFGRCLLIVPKASNSLNGNRTASYLTYQAAVTANGLGYISAATLKGIRTIFAQTNVPAQGVLVGNVDLVAPEGYDDALLAIVAEDPVFYLICILSRVSADIEAVSALVETMNDKAAAALATVPFKYCAFCAQTADTTVLTGAYPAGLAGLEDREYTILVFHPTSTEWFDASHQCRLSVDLSTVVPGWIKWPVRAVAAYPAGTITETQRLAAESINVDLLLTFGNTANGLFVAGPGQNQAGRQMTEIVTAAWLATDLQVVIANLFVALALVNEKLTVTPNGQQAIVASIQGVIETGIQAGSIRATDDEGNAGYSIVAEPISDADKVAKQMRFSVVVLLPIGADKIVINIATTTTSVV